MTSKSSGVYLLLVLKKATDDLHMCMAQPHGSAGRPCGPVEAQTPTQAQSTLPQA